MLALSLKHEKSGGILMVDFLVFCGFQGGFLVMHVPVIGTQQLVGYWMQSKTVPIMVDNFYHGIRNHFMQSK
jgi:hypothetical protein